VRVPRRRARRAGALNTSIARSTAARSGRRRVPFPARARTRIACPRGENPREPGGSWPSGSPGVAYRKSRSTPLATSPHVNHARRRDAGRAVLLVQLLVGCRLLQELAPTLIPRSPCRSPRCRASRVPRCSASRHHAVAVRPGSRLPRHDESRRRHQAVRAPARTRHVLTREAEQREHRECARPRDRQR